MSIAKRDTSETFNRLCKKFVPMLKFTCLTSIWTPDTLMSNLYVFCPNFCPSLKLAQLLEKRFTDIGRCVGQLPTFLFTFFAQYYI
jgi:hypothetical protein